MMLRLSDSEHAALKQLAEHEHRSMAGMIRHLIYEAVTDHRPRSLRSEHTPVT